MKKINKIVLIAGARPNFMKIAPVINELKDNPDIVVRLVHTGQHYDFKMSDVFFQDLEITKPDAFLEVGSGLHGEQTAKVMIVFEKWCIENKPDRIVVAGDVNSTMACAIVGAKLQIPVAHVESGLRSSDMTMPEEINRIVTDKLSDILFITCEDAKENLVKENTFGKIIFVGNPMIDSLISIEDKLDDGIFDKLKIEKNKYSLITLHRPGNVDVEEKLQKIAEILNTISNQMKLIFPVHPRTLKNLKKFNLENSLINKNIILTEPLSYKDFINLEKNAQFVLTDSGGIQEETTFYKVPCLTLRPNTERPITITEGTNELVHLDVEIISEYVDKIVKGEWKEGKIPKLWDGRAGERIAESICKW